MNLKLAIRDKGDFEKGSVAWDVLNATARHRTQLPHIVDLSESVHLKPYSVACLAAIGRKTRGTAQLVLPTDRACRDHLLRMGLQKFFAPTPALADSDFVARGTNVVIRGLEADRKPGNAFAEEVVGLLVDGNQHDLDLGQRADLENHVDEIVRNALTHSDSPIGCVVAGQLFPKERFVEAAVLDLGQTIRGHLSSREKYRAIENDTEAIVRATEDGVTGTEGLNRWNEPNSGAGLTELRRFCESGRGHMTVLSGDAYACFGGNEGPKTNPFRGYFAGCLVHIRFFIGEGLNFRPTYANMKW